jgi:hypothetical protein
MEINKAKFEAIVKTAVGKAGNNTRWVNAINKAADAILNNRWIITPLAHSYAITTESGNTYFANGVCQCKAYALNTPCKHRCAARLLDLYFEMEAAEQAASRCDVIIADIKAIGRETLIAEIESTFSANFPGYHLADSVQAMFGGYSLNNLHISKLTAFLTAIAA